MRPPERAPGLRTRALLLLVGLGLLGASSRLPAQITVGSKNFTENIILGEVMAQLIELRTDLEVSRRLNLGGTVVVWTALQKGEIDLYVEYTGTGWGAIMKRPPSDDPLQVYLGVQRFYEREHEVRWMPPFGFANSFALALREDVAERLGVRAISDLRGKETALRAGFHHEFLNRDDGWKRLPDHYGLSIENVRGMDHGLAYQAIEDGQIDLIDSWTTDGNILRYPIRILEDDQAFWPPYDAAPIVRVSTLQRHPEIEGLLRELAFRIDDERMQQLNAAVEIEKRSVAEVARDFLLEEKLTDERGGVGPSNRQLGFWAYFWAERMTVASRLLEHVVLTFLAIAICVLLAVPVGILLSRRQDLAPPFLTAAGIVQTIPSLALLALLIALPGLGLGFRSALVALTLYSVLPVLRNTYTGLKEVDPSFLEAAQGMGLSNAERLRLIELPLAGRTIMAGIRTATVVGIGIATLAAFIGAGGLGNPILSGLQLNDPRLVLLGAVPAAVLAVGADALLGLIERRWRASGRGARAAGPAAEEA